MNQLFSRRTFLERSLSIGAIGVTTAGLCVCMLSGCLKNDRTPVIHSKWLEIRNSEIIVRVGQIDALRQVGGAAKIVHSQLNEPIIVVRPTEVDFLALSGNCTHRGRALEYIHSEKELRCINFGHSIFSLEGIPRKGPAQKALHVYRTLYLHGTLEIFL